MHWKGHRRSKQGENIIDAYEDTRFNKTIDQQLGYRTKSILCEPIYFRGDLLAVGQLVNKKFSDGEVTCFSDDDKDTFQTFANFAGIALSNAQLLKFAVKAGEEAMHLNSMLDEASNRSHSSTDDVLSRRQPSTKPLCQLRNWRRFSPLKSTAIFLPPS